MQRLNKYIASSGICSRRKADELIEGGHVVVNGKVVKELGFQVSEKDKVFVDRKLIHTKKLEYYKFYKPSGYITTADDEKGRKTIYDILPENYKTMKPVGRLDKDTEGLLLLTDDGMLAHELLSPRKHVDKVYFAKVSGQFGENEIDRFKEGLDIGNGERSKQARLQILKADAQRSEVLITITEGKFHQVKRMVKAVGSEVLYLKRLSMGPLKLDEELKLGEYRRLTQAELQELKEHRR